MLQLWKPDFKKQINQAATQGNLGAIAAILQKDVETPQERKTIVTETARIAGDHLGRGQIDAFWILADYLGQYATAKERNEALPQNFKRGLTILCLSNVGDDLQIKLEQTLPRATKTHLAGQDADYWGDFGKILLEAGVTKKLDRCASIIEQLLPEGMIAYAGLCHAGSERLEYLNRRNACVPATSLLCDLVKYPQLMSGITPEQVADTGMALLAQEGVRNTVNFAALACAFEDKPAFAHALLSIPAAENLLVFTPKQFGSAEGTSAVVQLGVSTRMVLGENVSSQPLRSYLDRAVIDPAYSELAGSVAPIFEGLAKSAEKSGQSGQYAALELLALQPYYEARWRAHLGAVTQGRVDSVYRWSNQCLNARKLQV